MISLSVNMWLFFALPSPFSHPTRINAKIGSLYELRTCDHLDRNLMFTALRCHRGLLRLNPKWCRLEGLEQATGAFVRRSSVKVSFHCESQMVYTCFAVCSHTAVSLNSGRISRFP